MAVSLLSHEVSDLCIGKPALRALPISATVGEALLALRRSGDTHLSVWNPDRSTPEKKTCAGKICMVDILCYLCSEECVASPLSALKNPVSALLSKEAPALVRRVEKHWSVLEALNVILDGAHILLVPIRSAASSRKKLHHLHHGGSVVAGDFCLLTQEGFARFFFNSISSFSPIATLSVTQLGLVRSDGVLAVHYHDPALSALPLIRRALMDQTSVAVVTDDRKLIGEISPFTLAGCDESVAAALAALSAGDLMAYIDWCVPPPEAVVRAIKSILKEKGLQGMVALIDEELSPPLFSSSSSTSSSSEDEVDGLSGRRRTRSMGRSGSYSARMGRKAEEAIVCHPGSSLVAVMVQALAHRVGYVWVVEEDYGLVGIVVLRDILKACRDQLDQYRCL
ncbi:CBS domain-containing protein CBSX5 [Apostasia shenzhenica]|uniref:CBS domain-containing protein CBSX5 n=1 Tax=Apostasia shenzhenica TaxID=1088818 RepID=A0A2I0AKA3_9ASPA|nr:CBS domain-containing protein CBSX5 [Apostasia shenzhenica]